MTPGHELPLFVCHANCCRSVLACYLYRHLCHGAPALSAGVEVGERINDRAERMLSEWGIDASAHRPQQLSRTLCTEATAIFVMAPSYLHRVACEYGEDLADKAYLFADPFTRPVSLGKGRVHGCRSVVRRSTDHRAAQGVPMDPRASAADPTGSARGRQATCPAERLSRAL